ncbi:hypothetical protein KI688_007887 [Linnemannia hyalina]|uniref:Uncharacterized protein n=1 Tax=Linnemannia hyalina TaxID=64524 RepID=A0A9P7XJ71_9FUNG|nr:hypothetical protein KI688_007887 [Linnemannia hyalina]
MSNTQIPINENHLSSTEDTALDTIVGQLQPFTQEDITGSGLQADQATTSTDEIIRDKMQLENEKTAEYSRIAARRKKALNQLPLMNRDEASRAIDQLLARLESERRESAVRRRTAASNRKRMQRERRDLNYSLLRTSSTMSIPSTVPSTSVNTSMI